MFAMLNFIYVIGFTTIITSVVSSVCIFSTGAQIILSRSQHPVVSIAYLLPLTYVSLLFGFLYTMLIPLLFMFGILADVIQYSTIFNKNKYDYLINKHETKEAVVESEEAVVESEGSEEAEAAEAAEVVEAEIDGVEAEKKETYENETSDEEISKSQFDEETSDEETDKTKIDKKEFINYVINKCNTDVKYTINDSIKYTTDSYVKDSESSCKIGEKCESCDCSN